MNWPSARSSRASSPFSTTKRAPRHARGGLEVHQAERRAQIDVVLGVLRWRRARPSGGPRRCRARPRRPARRRPAGWAGPASSVVQGSRRRPARARSAAAIDALQRLDLGHQRGRPRPRPSCALAWPISLEARCGGSGRPAARSGRRAARRPAPAAPASAAPGPREAQARSKAPGSSRMALMSCMGARRDKRERPSLRRVGAAVSPGRPPAAARRRSGCGRASGHSPDGRGCERLRYRASRRSPWSAA